MGPRQALLLRRWLVAYVCVVAVCVAAWVIAASLAVSAENMTAGTAGALLAVLVELLTAPLGFAAAIGLGLTFGMPGVVAGVVLGAAFNVAVVHGVWLRPALRNAGISRMCRLGVPR